MKKVLSLALVAAFSVSVYGCSASVEADEPKNGDSSYKKTTTVDRDGDRTVRTEKRTVDRD
ncbi:MAG TPA: hypothetical protein VER17_05710 [Tepidisphaeraceae bacterium]|nr:hypothetical protein [Tepidisphaeraceae bacterium]